MIPVQSPDTKDLQRQRFGMIVAAVLSTLVPLAVFLIGHRTERRLTSQSMELHLASIHSAQEAMLHVEHLLATPEPSRRGTRDSTRRRQNARLNAIGGQLDLLLELQRRSPATTPDSLTRRLQDYRDLVAQTSGETERTGALRPHLPGLRLALDQLRLLQRGANADIQSQLRQHRSSMRFFWIPASLALSLLSLMRCVLWWRSIDGKWLRESVVRQSQQRQLALANDTQEQLRDELASCQASIKTLQESDERHVLVERAVNDGIWDWNMVTNDVFYSPRFKAILEYEPGDEFPATFETLRQHMHPEDREQTMDTLWSNLSGESHCDTVCRLRTKSGEWRSFRIRAASNGSMDTNTQRMAGSISDITREKIAEEELLQAALTDKLTGLSNRALLLDRLRCTLARSRREGTHFAVMFLDFDRFKIVNDSLGHDLGDELLRQIADRLRMRLRAVDAVARISFSGTAARLGGDEFVVLLDKVRETSDAMVLAERLLQTFAEPFQLGPHQMHSTASIGVVLGGPQYERAEDVLRDADTAMYEAKRKGKARYVLFDSAMRESVQRRVQLETDLHNALGTEQLSLYYQPIVSLVTGEITGVEALLRWKHPTLGFVPPDEFIVIAQESDLILKLGEWALREACHQSAEWQQLLGVLAPRNVNVNLARKQFATPKLVDTVKQVLAETRLPPHRLQLEVTEDAFAGDTVAAIRTMNMIRDLGVKLAIDDFGAGSSTFASLHQFPVNVLKLDRSLVSNIENSIGESAMIHGLVVMARNLGIDVVAEGIERSTQARVIQELGCHYAQGYFFARPMPSDKLIEHLLQNPSVAWQANGAAALASTLADRMACLEEVD